MLCQWTKLVSISSSYRDTTSPLGEISTKRTQFTNAGNNFFSENHLSRAKSASQYPKLSSQSEKTADILRLHYWFPRKITPEKQAQKFHTDDVSLIRSG